MAAELAGTSSRTLQRRLIRYGTSYAELGQEVRVQVARKMLSDDSMRICDVARMTGYENPQHFSRAFRRMTGLSPTEYRGFRTEDAMPALKRDRPSQPPVRQ
jgi:transcriptional regulator GlxA family with amidase domain